jgi:hypothetical protein
MSHQAKRNHGGLISGHFYGCDALRPSTSNESTSNERVGDWCQCFSGETFFVFDPHTDEVHIEDIAHHLSLLCRYSGACKVFYGVGEHSVRVLLETERLACRDRLFAIDVEAVRLLSLCGLLHDASEAYLGDMIRPLKLGMSEYRKVENRVQACICEAFGLDPVEPPIVKIADRRLLATERRDLMPLSKLAWRTDEQVEPLLERIVPMSPAMAEIAFMDRFNELRGGR